MQISLATLEKPTDAIIFRRPGDTWDHRAQIIRMACEFELTLTDMCVDWLKSANPGLDSQQARKEFFEEGPISSLKKLADLAFFAGIVGPKTRHDLRKFSALRDRYAHDRERRQLQDDPPMYALLQQTYTYKDNAELLKSEHHYGVLVRVFYQILECLNVRHFE